MATDYALVDRIGNGSFGEVWKATRIVDGETVAIKKLRVPDDERLKTLPAAIFQEIEAMRQLEHPSIVRLEGIHAEDSYVCLVMEYLPLDLHTVIHRSKVRFDENEIRCIMKMLLEAVACCHHHSIMHRDIKPGNLLLHLDGTMKLSDFGLATVYVGSDVTYNHQVATRWYRAPELLFASRCYDPKVDIWSVGAIFAELLNHAPLFAGLSDIDQLNRIFQVLGSIEDQWPEVVHLPDYHKVSFPEYRSIPFTDVLPDASKDALDLLSRLLALDPNQRLSASQALQHPYLSSTTPKRLLSFPSDLSIVSPESSNHSIDEQEWSHLFFNNPLQATD